jgi:lipopolysaccharide/colanic/teichoic acid biosynthesis glycosyltransferase
VTGSRPLSAPLPDVSERHAGAATLLLLVPPPAGERSALELAPWLRRYSRKGMRRARTYLRVKRAFDLLVVLLLAPVWIPLVVLVSLLVKLQDVRSPAHYSQLRTGLHERRFRVHKFRTMVREADALKESLRHLNQRTWPDFKIDPDPRVTGVGRVLRATSLDELPQLFDVLLGRMSLVGPRPTSLPPDAYVPWQLERFDGPGGITGLWQIAGRGSPSFVERVRLDVAYGERRCLLLDLEILARTIPAVLLRSGAC